MKKIIFVLCVFIAFSVSSVVYGVTITDDFEDYDTGDLIVQSGGGSNWNGAWQNGMGGNASWDCVDETGQQYGQFASGDDSVIYRKFSQALNDITTFTFVLRLETAPSTDAAAGEFTIWSDGDGKAIRLGFYDDGGTLEIRDFVSNNQIRTVSVSTAYTITITNVDFNGDTYGANAGTGVVACQFANDVNNFIDLGFAINTNGGVTQIDDINITGVPEPSTYALFGIGIFGLIIGWMGKML